MLTEEAIGIIKLFEELAILTISVTSSALELERRTRENANNSEWKGN